jgi:hypothetical protein
MRATFRFQRQIPGPPVEGALRVGLCLENTFRAQGVIPFFVFLLFVLFVGLARFDLGRPCEGAPAARSLTTEYPNTTGPAREVCCALSPSRNAGSENREILKTKRALRKPSPGKPETNLISPRSGLG